jgi:hypothetical protein
MFETYSLNPIYRSLNYKGKIIRKVDSYSIMEFKDRLSEELWQNIFDNASTIVGSIFNSFFDRYHQIYYSCFPKIKVYERQTINV